MPRMLAAALSAIALGPTLDACTPASERCAPRPEPIAAPLVNGTARSPYLLLAASEEAAVVQLDVGPPGQEPTLCSGVLVSDRFVLTAAHCTTGDGDGAIVRFGPLAGEPLLELRSSTLLLHPELDLMLVELPGPVAGPDLDPIPIAPQVAELTRELVGQRAELAGYGLDAEGGVGQRGFAVQPIRDVGIRFVTVSGDARSGACAGDSGGPLLIRDESGRPRVIGVLSAGSSTCVAEDIYTRLDLAGTWLEQHLGPAEDAPRPCGGLTAAGRCFGQVAVHCSSDDTLRATPCDAPLACGYSLEAEGYRCLEPELDACAGIGALGACDGPLALRCDRGVLEARDCGACAMVCELAGGSGEPTCAAD